MPVLRCPTDRRHHPHPEFRVRRKRSVRPLQLRLDRSITAARLLVRELRHLHECGDVISLAWVVMPDHLHWLIQLKHRSNEFDPTGLIRVNEFDPTALSRVVKTLKARSALAVNRYLCRRGSLWQRAYYDRAARKDDDIRQMARYIVANPLRAGLVRHIGDYPHWDCIWMTGCGETPLVE